MQVHDLLCDLTVANPFSDLPIFTAMSDSRGSSPSSTNGSYQDKSSPQKIDANHVNNYGKNGTFGTKSNHLSSEINTTVRKERPSRACTLRAAARLQAAAVAEADTNASERKSRKKAALKKEKLTSRLLKEEVEDRVGEDDLEEDGDGGVGEGEGEGEGESNRIQQCSRIVTPLVGEPELSQLPRWNLRGMWELASVLNFLNVFRPLLNVNMEFSVEELETALLTPNKTLAEIHIPLLKAIPPVVRAALGHSTWVTVLCKKLRDWWHWVAEGEIPVVASHGAEIEAYSALDPAVRVVILKALCDIRVEQEDIRNYIDSSIKQGAHLSGFRKERIGGDSYGISYWYEDDPIIGHRLYREIRKVEVKKGKGKNVSIIPNSSYQWSTVATNLDEFQNVSEKLFSSRNKMEFSVGKKVKNDMLPEIEKVQKSKETLLKRQQKQALMLDNMMNVDGLLAGRSLRDRKPVTYTFDDYDRSITEAIKTTKKKQLSPEPTTRREGDMKIEAQPNGRWRATSNSSLDASSKSFDFDGYSDGNGEEPLDRSDRRRQRPQRYSAGEFVEEVSDFEPEDMDSDDDIEGEAVYDEEYLKKRKKRRHSSSSEGSDEYRGDDEESLEEEDEDDYMSPSDEESEEEPRKYRKLPGRTRRETKSRSMNMLRSGLRRSERATRNRIDYKKYELSESETESVDRNKFNNISDEHSNTSGKEEDDFSEGSEGTEDEDEEEEDMENNNMKTVQSTENQHETIVKDVINPPEKTSNPHEGEGEGEAGRKRHFLDLNELAPGSGFDDGAAEDDDTDDL